MPELWALFVEVLNNSLKFSWLLDELVDVIWKAVELSKDKMSTDYKIGQVTVGVRNAIFDLVYSEAHPMYERVEIKLFLILKELDSGNDAFVKVVKDLLSQPMERTDFSRIDQPLEEEDFSEELKLPDIWHTPYGYSRLFKVVYGLLDSLKNKQLKSLLREWAESGDINLSYGAYIFLDYSWKKDKLKDRCREREESSVKKPIKSMKINKKSV
jgi:hypothetical protein